VSVEAFFKCIYLQSYILAVGMPCVSQTRAFFCIRNIKIFKSK
jgi:hypothetical protein